MKLDVPFFPQTSKVNCGPMALRMALAYLDNDPGIEKVEEAVGIREGKGVSTIELALASAKLGFKTKLFTKHLGFNEENRKLEFYNKYIDTTEERSNKLLVDAKNAGIGLLEKTLGIEEVLGHVSKDSLVIVLMNWNVVKGEEGNGYQGHFVPVIGFDEENVYVHNQGRKNPEANLAITREVFDKARKSAGTDEDIVVVYRKK
jgi:hypothetical protein